MPVGVVSCTCNLRVSIFGRPLCESLSVRLRTGVGDVGNRYITLPSRRKPLSEKPYSHSGFHSTPSCEYSPGRLAVAGRLKRLSPTPSAMLDSLVYRSPTVR